MNFKKLKEKLTGKKPLKEGKGFIGLKNRLDEASKPKEEVDEATFDWSKFPEPKPPTWDQRTKVKSAEKNRDFSKIGPSKGPAFKGDDSSDGVKDGNIDITGVKKSFPSAHKRIQDITDDAGDRINRSYSDIDFDFDVTDGELYAFPPTNDEVDYYLWNEKDGMWEIDDGSHL